MPKKVIFYTYNYRKNEGISKEVSFLLNNLEQSILFNIDLNRFKLEISRKRISCPLILAPIFLILTKVIFPNSRDHVFTSLGDRFYLKLLPKKKLFLTASAGTSDKKIFKNINRIRRLEKIILESDQTKSKLLKLGVPKDKMRIIYPFSERLDLREKDCPRLRIGFASSPLGKNLLKERGVFLILDTAQKLKEVDFNLYWRGDFYLEISEEIKKRKLKNVHIINQILTTEEILSSSDIFVAPFTSLEGIKDCPNSIVDSIYNLKPVLVTKYVGISRLISKHKLGLVFQPTVEDFYNKIIQIKENPIKIQSIIVGRLFSNKQFLNQYKQLYKKN